MSFRNPPDFLNAPVRHGARMNRTGVPQVVPTGTLTTITNWAEVFDTDGYFDAAVDNKIVTVPAAQAGVYIVCVAAPWRGGGNQYDGLLSMGVNSDKNAKGSTARALSAGRFAAGGTQAVVVAHNTAGGVPLNFDVSPADGSMPNFIIVRLDAP